MAILLFDKDGNGSAELEALTGQWYASSPYRGIATEIEFATREVASRVGDAVVRLAAETYAADKGEESGLVRAVRLPVACLALLRHASLTSVSHESTGRKVKMDENEKMPFEWMVDRDDRAMRERYYRALDALYAYLTDNNVKEWTESDVYKSAQRSVVKSIREFEAVYPVDGSYYVYYMMQPLVLEAQQAVLKPLAGDKWDSVLDGTADSALVGYARKAAVLSALITAGERWSLEVFPLEIARRFSPSYQGNRASNAATTSEIDWYLDKLRAQRKEAINGVASLLDPDGAGYSLIPDNDPRRKFFTTV